MVSSQKQFVGPFVRRLDSHHQVPQPPVPTYHHRSHLPLPVLLTIRQITTFLCFRSFIECVPDEHLNLFIFHHEIFPLNGAIEGERGHHLKLVIPQFVSFKNVWSSTASTMFCTSNCLLRSVETQAAISLEWCFMTIEASAVQCSRVLKPFYVWEIPCKIG